MPITSTQYNAGLGCHFLAALDGTAITPEVRQLIEKEHVAGFTLFTRNFQNVTDLFELNRELSGRARAAGYEIILAVDQEGGRVSRLPEPFSQIPPMRLWGERLQKTGDRRPLFELGRMLGAEVRAAGFNLNFAPVTDIDTNPASPIIGDRSFSSDPQIVAEAAQIVSCGILSQGVTTCLKHFPGHGDTRQDSHLTLPRDARAAATIKNCDLTPYRRLIHAGLAPTIMTAHVVYPNLDPDNPATLSPAILTGLLRGELGFNGVIFSDDLLMQAIADGFDIAAAARRFFLAGGDCALICKQPGRTLAVIVELRNDLGRNDATARRLGNSLKMAQTRLIRLRQRYLAHSCPSADPSVRNVSLA